MQTKTKITMKNIKVLLFAILSMLVLSSNAQVLEELSSEGGAYEGNEAYIPRSGYEKDEMFHDNEVLRKELSELWIKVKLHE